MSTATNDKPIRAGIFADVKTAEEAVRSLIKHGFPKDELTVVCSNETREKHFGTLRHSSHDITEADKPVILESGIIGALLGGLVSLVGVTVTGGLGILAVGPIVAGGIGGTLFGLFVGRGIEDEVARFYDQAVARGSILVAVESDDPEHLALAERIFEECGSQSVALDEG